MRMSQQEEHVVPSFYFYNNFNNILHYHLHSLSKISPTALAGSTQKPPKKTKMEYVKQSLDSKILVVGSHKLPVLYMKTV